MKEKIVLIDGHSILNRAFYGVPDLTNNKGLHTNAIYGFLNILFKILKEENPTHITVAFDVKAPTFRHEMFADYKGTRKPMLDELRQQVPVMKEVLRSMNITIVEQPGLEADDVLGTIAQEAQSKGMDVSIISGDRDLLQLATDVIKIRIPKTKQGKTIIEDYYEDQVMESYQVTPTQFIDVKALMGDPSDNIPGVPSIGEKTATKLIVEYGSIENAHAHVEELKPPRASKAMQEHYDMAVMSKVLATINIQGEFDYNLEEATLRDMFNDSSYRMYVDLGFKNLLAKFKDVTISEEALQATTEEGSTQKETQGPTSESYMVNTKFSTQEVQGKEDALALLQGLSKYPVIGLSTYKDDCSDMPLFASLTEISGIAIALPGAPVYLIKGDLFGGFAELVEAFLLASVKVETIATFDLKSLLAHINIPAHQGFDNLLAAYLLNPLKSDYEIFDLANEFLGLYPEAMDSQVLTAAYNAYICSQSHGPLIEKLEESNMLNLYHTMEQPLIYTLFNMEQNGVKVQASELKVYGDQLVGTIAELEQNIYEAAGETFNINSPKQLGVILFEKLEMPHGKKTKTGYSTAADVLDKLAAQYPVVKDILQYRQLSKLKSTYADGLANYIKEDGRIHGKFNQTITATGRISSTEPNLQNIPNRMELGRLIRKVFVPEEGYVFLDADYSQIELRVLAHCSGDEQLIEGYKNNADIHRLTASQVFHTPFDQVTDKQRSEAKAVNFGIVYGMGSFSLGQDLGISKAQAQDYIDRYFATYPKIKGFLDQAIANGKAMGYVDTIFGRRRPVPELSSSNFMQRAFGERVAMNAPIQGAAADIMKLAMNNVSKELLDRKLRSKLVLQVHDELLIETHKDEIEEVKVILKEGMEGAASLLVELAVDMQQGDNWYEAK